MNVTIFSRSAFGIATLLAAAVSFATAWDLRSLYLDASLRSQITKSMQSVADERGWLLSDLEVTCDSLSHRWSVAHRDHLRFSTVDEVIELSSSLPSCGV